MGQDLSYAAKAQYQPSGHRKYEQGIKARICDGTGSSLSMKELLKETPKAHGIYLHDYGIMYQIYGKCQTAKYLYGLP